MTAAEILRAIPGLSVLVVGDICLDRWCTYDPATAEPSSETGIPRIGVVQTEVTPGAGGTVANNLSDLGAGSVAVAGVIGDDGFGIELRRALEARGVETSYLVVEPALQTFTYTKLLNRGTQLEDQPRIDFINTQPMPERAEREIMSNLELAVSRFDVVLVSDQAETEAGGVVTLRVREWLSGIALAFEHKVVFVDSRKRIELFRHAVLKPNRVEAESACRRLFGVVDYSRLRRETAAPLLMVTHGDRGVLLVDQAGAEWVRTRPVEKPVDICGAGDSFSAGAALALAAGASAREAAAFGNLVASITISKKGTGTASPDEVLAAQEQI